MYLTYDEYTEKGGTLDKPAFEHLEFRAESLLNEFCLEWLRHKIEKLPIDDVLWNTIKEFMFIAVSKLDDLMNNNVTSIKNMELSVTMQVSTSAVVVSELYDLFVTTFPLEWVNVTNEI